MSENSIDKTKPLTELRLQLVRGGYTPLPLYGKTPPVLRKNNQRGGLANWEKLEGVTREQIEMWARTWPDAVNTGALTRKMPTLDIDLLNEGAANTMKSAAMSSRVLVSRRSARSRSKLKSHSIRSSSTSMRRTATPRRSNFWPTDNKSLLPASIPTRSNPTAGMVASLVTSSSKSFRISAEKRRSVSLTRSSSF
jgi:hypothetical protein